MEKQIGPDQYNIKRNHKSLIEDDPIVRDDTILESN